MDNKNEFLQAVKAGDLAQVQALVLEDATLLTVAENGVPAALLSAYHFHAEIGNWLADQGAPLDIFTAAALGRLEQVRMLVEQDPALVNALAPDGFQPLGLAAFFRQVDAAGYLIEHGADVNAASQNAQQVMPLHSAAAAQSFDLVRLLVEHGAEVNARQTGGFTPLHAAAQNGQIELVAYLIGQGAEVNPRSDAGSGPLSAKTPFTIAQEAGYADVAALLAHHGGTA